MQHLCAAHIIIGVSSLHVRHLCAAHIIIGVSSLHVHHLCAAHRDSNLEFQLFLSSEQLYY